MFGFSNIVLALMVKTVRGRLVRQSFPKLGNQKNYKKIIEQRIAY